MLINIAVHELVNLSENTANTMYRNKIKSCDWTWAIIKQAFVFSYLFQFILNKGGDGRGREIEVEYYMQKIICIYIFSAY